MILTTFRHDEYVWGALRAGASGFLLKRASPERLLDAVRTIASGEALVDPSITRDLIHRSLSAGTDMRIRPPPRAGALARLTEREQQVLRSAGSGPLQCRDRRPAGDRGIDGQDPREAGAGQDRRP